MRILHFIDSLDYGGAETLLMSYIPLLDEHEHIVATLQGPNVYRKANYEYIQLNYRPVKGFFNSIKRLRRIIAEKEIDIVHAHSFWTNIISRFATPKDKKLINHYHFADYDTMKHKLSVKRMVLIDKMTRHKRLVRVGVSEYVGSILSGTFPKARVEVVPNFIKCIPGKAKRNAVRFGTLKIVAVGNCNIEKNYEFLIRVFTALKDEPINIDIIGGGSRLDYYRNKVKGLGLQKICFCGIEPRVREKLPEYDLFLSTSVSETFGMAVLEGVCAELPLLLSYIPAFKEIAPNGAVFFDPYSVNDLLSNIKNCLAEPYKVNKHEYNKVLKKYSGESFLLKIRDLYLK
jgi:hypothetical protein